MAQAKAESEKAKEMKLKTATKIAEQMRRDRETWTNGKEERRKKRELSKKRAAAKEIVRQQESRLRIKLKQEKEVAKRANVESRLRKRKDEIVEKVGERIEGHGRGKKKTFNMEKPQPHFLVSICEYKSRK